MAKVDQNLYIATGHVSNHPTPFKEKNLLKFEFIVTEFYNGTMYRNKWTVKSFGKQFEFLSKTLTKGVFVAVESAPRQESIPGTNGKIETVLYAKTVKILNTAIQIDQLKEIFQEN
jgi:hypothetical protein